MRFFTCCLLFAIPSLCPVVPVHAATRPPNIVILFMDDLGWKDLSVTGSAFYDTPNIDRLAAGGALFTRAYAAAPLCAPSRGALLSGKYPARTKFTSVRSNAADDSLFSQSKMLGVGNTALEAAHRQNLPSTEKVFAERFQATGYATGFTGKWHAGRQPGYHPLDRGFDEAYAIRKEGGYFYYLTQPQIDLLEGVEEAQPGDYLPELMTNWATEFIGSQVAADRPFLLHVCHFLVHTPIVAKKDLVTKYERRREAMHNDQDHVAYATMVQAMDDSVGRIVDQVEALGQLDNTLIIFTSDNGGFTRGGITSNYPLMGGKSFAYEGGYRVPFIAHWPGRIPAGQIHSKRVIGTDVYPTMLEAAGLPLDPEQHADGFSLLGELTQGATGSPVPDRALYFHHPHYTHASSPHSAVIDGDYKLIRYYNDETGRHALFNLSTDPGEQNDLAEMEPETVERLAGRLTDFLTEVDAELPIPSASADGRRLLKLHAEEATKGFSPWHKDATEVMNQATERALALEERRVQERKLTGRR